MKPIFGLLLSSSLVFAAADEVPSLITPGGAWWIPKTILEIQQAIELTAPTRLEADEIIIAKPVVTNGYPLALHARRIRFAGEGRIDGFTAPPGSAVAAAAYGGPAKSGAKESGPGDDGASGMEGNPGTDGLGADGKDLPGEIFLFGADIDGDVVISGQGQKGGQGGVGGEGQKGGEGGRGKNAVASDPCSPFGNDWKAGSGGRGGKFGKGGKGGDGGRGGAPVPLSILTAWRENPATPFENVTSAPGYGGEAGLPGKPGEPGDAGPGGAGDSNSCWFFGVSRKVYPAGDPGLPGVSCTSVVANGGMLTGWMARLFTSILGSPCREGDTECILKKCTEGTGKGGVVGEPVSPAVLKAKLSRQTNERFKTYDEFERKRLAVTLSWYDFHWRRHFENLLHGSVLLLDDLEISKKEGEKRDLLSLGVDGDFQQELIDTVSAQWKATFVEPLKRQQARFAEDPVVLSRLTWALERSAEFSAALAKFEQKDQTATVSGLKELTKTLRADRKRVLSALGDECRGYLQDVIQSDEFTQELQRTQYHFDIPACLELPLFSEEGEGPMRPIVLLRDIEPFASDNVKNDIKFSVTAPGETKPTAWRWLEEATQNLFGLFLPRMAFAEGEKPFPFKFTLLPAQRIDREAFRQSIPVPALASRLGKLGLHKGYLTLTTDQKNYLAIVEQLHGLSQLVGRP